MSHWHIAMADGAPQCKITHANACFEKDQKQPRAFRGIFITCYCSSGAICAEIPCVEDDDNGIE